MAKELLATVSSKGQVTLPKPVRELLQLELGDLIRFKPAPGGILLTKIAVVEEEFSASEWRALERLASRRGRRYQTAKEFLKSLDRS